MVILSTLGEKAERRLANIRADIESARTRLGAGLEFDAGFALREEIALLERKEAAAVEALGTAKVLEAKAAKDAERAKDVAEIEAYRREAEREMPSRLRKLDKHVEAAAAEVTAIDVHVKRASHINALARKHGLPPVVDGETLFRATPVKSIPAQFEERDRWVDGAGNSPSVFRKNGDGELVPEEGGYAKVRERVQVAPERTEGGTLPGGRLAAAIRLVSLNGRQIWPLAR